ncbi:DUF1816 domain-containing protein [Cyanobacterium stanieri LEGE 03274]|uniref:DUF1816 domain-containing protein n=1 Tax=Cyanobacterium stanieri LEGE 03274 TaxID=1828756 RepID=A0ABR9V2W7_9CHRO|nr:DUF1816 domain-containing protein [Cyanobacterium stanieri]MBE9221164.1 DUF1816 domain-containing protein [Cyanobacterium stanieri LEGE 03274]
MKELLIQILNFFGWACWLKVTTENPRCTYYFGPFLTQKEARENQQGYIDDLLEEGAKEIKISIRRFKPTELTIFDDLADLNNASQRVKVSGQPSLNL